MAGNRPDVGDVHVNALLTNISVAYRNEVYVADKVFPIVGVGKQSDIIPSYNKSDWLRDEMDLRAPGAVAREAGWQVTTTDTYFCHGYALRKLIPDEVRANADAPFDIDRDAVTFLTDKAMLHRERQFATVVNASGSWTSTGTIGAKWSDFANSDPIDDIITTKRTIHQLIGREPNVFVIGQIVRDRLVRHPDFVDLIKYIQTGIVTEQIMARALGLTGVYVVLGIYESAVEGASTSVVPVWDDDAVLMYVPSAPSLMAPAAGYTFVWKSLTGGGPQYMRRYRLEERTTDVIEVRSYFAVKATAADAGAHWSDCVD